MNDILRLSPLSKTWIFDLDGTLVKHNGYKIDGEDSLLEGVKSFFEKIQDKDMVIILTARSSQYREQTVNFLKKQGIRFDLIIFDAPKGERIIFNDKKPSGLQTAFCLNQDRDQFIPLRFEIDETL
ncbi:hypothetical protein M3649_16885 [Ureibacillus chungkukjangi]|uniref:NIF family HAD-type phosphatase n=1 Tax=Ureibacillus chungkukjangi TaxID=1202712 RepID=UPI00203D911F|nr:NIF family HAD-type phosphatase [Ureibacillus chungkukjangi]MCM3389797.1 hypothetical protein [Ureibacillus chungkukjangi]